MLNAEYSTELSGENTLPPWFACVLKLTLAGNNSGVRRILLRDHAQAPASNNETSHKPDPSGDTESTLEMLVTLRLFRRPGSYFENLPRRCAGIVHPNDIATVARCLQMAPRGNIDAVEVMPSPWLGRRNRYRFHVAGAGIVE